MRCPEPKLNYPDNRRTPLLNEIVARARSNRQLGDLPIYVLAVSDLKDCEL